MNKLLAIAACGAVAALLCACTDDVFDATYSSRADAANAGAMARGWIPAWLPPEAFDIREVHDIDTDESALLFRLPTGFKWRPPQSCDPAYLGQFHPPAFDREWIPEVREGYDIYMCPCGSAGPPRIMAGVAVQQVGGRVLHWRVHSK